MFEIEDIGAVRRLTLNNPDRRNAISSGSWPVLMEHFDDFEASSQRALVLTGAGGHFCSGADLADQEFPQASVLRNYELVGAVGAAAKALHRISKPTIAAVDGAAVGAGMNLALGCDVVIASDTARFAELFVLRGLIVDFGGVWLLPRLVGLAKAKELALTGRSVDASEALEIGLVARVVAPADLAGEALRLAEELAAGAPLAQRFIKAGLDRSLDMTFEEALAYENQAQAISLSSEDFLEGVAAFLQKRDPEFKGK